MAQLIDDTRKESGNHSSISRAQIWIKSCSRKNGKLVNMDVANTTEKVKQIESESQSPSSPSVREDAISLVLGQDRLGQVRAFGRGANHIKCRLLQARDTQAAQFQMRISELEEEVRMPKENQVFSLNKVLMNNQWVQYYLIL